MAALRQLQLSNGNSGRICCNMWGRVRSWVKL